MVTHSSLDAHSKRKVAVLYRVMKEDEEGGAEVRMRVLDLEKEEVKTDIMELAMREIMIFPSTMDYVLGNFYITAMSFVNDTLVYARSIDHYQYRVLMRYLDDNSESRW